MASLMGGSAVWAVGYIIEVFADTLSGFRLANGVEYIGIVSIPVFWLIFTLQYTGRDNWLTHNPYLLLVLPLITLILVWTNPSHHLMWSNPRLAVYGEFIVQIKNYGPWFWIHSFYSYLLFIIGIVVLSRRVFHPAALIRNQSIVLLIAALFPWPGMLFL